MSFRPYLLAEKPPQEWPNSSLKKSLLTPEQQDALGMSNAAVNNFKLSVTDSAGSVTLNACESSGKLEGQRRFALVTLKKQVNRNPSNESNSAGLWRETMSFKTTVADE